MDKADPKELKTAIIACLLDRRWHYRGWITSVVGDKLVPPEQALCAAQVRKRKPKTLDNELRDGQKLVASEALTELVGDGIVALRAGPDGQDAQVILTANFPSPDFLKEAMQRLLEEEGLSFSADSPRGGDQSNSHRHQRK